MSAVHVHCDHVVSVSMKIYIGNNSLNNDCTCGTNVMMTNHVYHHATKTQEVARYMTTTIMDEVNDLVNNIVQQDITHAAKDY